MYQAVREWAEEGRVIGREEGFRSSEAEGCAA